MKIIPAIDIINGKCVRLQQGNYNTKKIYADSPLEVAKRFENHGITAIHIVDLDAAKQQRIVNYTCVEEIAKQTNLSIDYGGGLTTDNDVRIAFESGVQQITIGSIAIKKPKRFENWLQQYGAEKIILGADILGKKIVINAWTKTSHKKLIPFLKYYLQKGVCNVICTDISKDGMLQGPSFSVYQTIISQLPKLSVIASGGVSTIQDLEQLRSIGCVGAIVGKAIYENKIGLKEIENHILQ